jgi:hypothetical protein
MSGNPCGHDDKFVVMLLPEDDNDCLACAFEHSIAREDALRSELAAANKLISDVEMLVSNDGPSVDALPFEIGEKIRAYNAAMKEQP